MSLTQTTRETSLAEPISKVRRRDLRLPLAILVAIVALSTPFLIGSMRFTPLSLP